MRIGIVVGEASGDLLAADLMREILARVPDAEFEGVAGERMLALGAESRFPMEKLSIMGLVEVLRHLPELLRLRAGLVRHFRANPPDVFIGVDAPDFNLTLERKLRESGIPTVHYVSPTVWAWREKRVVGIARAVDKVLALFPFEAEFYRSHDVGVEFVGHTLFDSIPIESDATAARDELGLAQDGEIVAVLPGSRGGELKRLGPLFLDTCAWLLARRPGLRFVIPLVNQRRRAQFEALLAARDDQLPITLVDGEAQQVMRASDCVLIASGTATLEGMLVKRPMVVAYKVAWLTAAIMRRMMKIDHFALPNLLADEPLVPEFIQENATVEQIGPAVLGYLEQPARRDALTAAFTDIHQRLRMDASARAAEAVLSLVEERRGG